MAEIPGFWDRGPHDPLSVQETWDEFVGGAGGQVVARSLDKSPTFENADYLFALQGVVAELKEVETEFARSPAFRKGFDSLLARVMQEDPSWRPLLLGGDGKFPNWFYADFVRLFRPHVSRILKKANRQIRATKRYFRITTPTGVLLLVNDGFATVGPDLIRALASSLLTHSYSSIDCFVYLTVNRYVEIRGSDVPRLVWAPTYSDHAPDALVDFIDDLGRRWFAFLEQKIGPFTLKQWETQDSNSLRGSRSIVLPGGTSKFA